MCIGLTQVLHFLHSVQKHTLSSVGDAKLIYGFIDLGVIERPTSRPVQIGFPALTLCLGTDATSGYKGVKIINGTRSIGFRLLSHKGMGDPLGSYKASILISLH